MFPAKLDVCNMLICVVFSKNKENTTGEEKYDIFTPQNFIFKKALDRRLNVWFHILPKHAKFSSRYFERSLVTFYFNACADMPFL